VNEYNLKKYINVVVLIPAADFRRGTANLRLRQGSKIELVFPRSSFGMVSAMAPFFERHIIHNDTNTSARTVLLQYYDRIDAKHDFILEGTRRYLSSPSCLDGVYSETFQRRLAEWSACLSSDYNKITIPLSVWLQQHQHRIVTPLLVSKGLEDPDLASNSINDDSNKNAIKALLEELDLGPEDFE
jgi:hypothetical protein